MTTLTSPSLSSTLSSLRFDWLMALLGVWLIGGLYLDGWAHNHNPDLETFFTPWQRIEESLVLPKTTMDATAPPLASE